MVSVKNKNPSSARLLSVLIQGCVSKLSSFSHAVLVPGCAAFPAEAGVSLRGLPAAPGTPWSDSMYPLRSPHAALCPVKAGLELPVCYMVSEQGSLAISLVQAVARFLICFSKSKMGLICCWIVLSHCSCCCNTDKNPVTSVRWELQSCATKATYIKNSNFRCIP